MAVLPEDSTQITGGTASGAGFLWLGVVLEITAGIALLAGVSPGNGSGRDGFWLFLAGLLGLLGTILVLIGVIAIGVRVGLRDHRSAE